MKAHADMSKNYAQALMSSAVGTTLMCYIADIIKIETALALCLSSYILKILYTNTPECQEIQEAASKIQQGKIAFFDTDASESLVSSTSPSKIY